MEEKIEEEKTILLKDDVNSLKYVKSELEKIYNLLYNVESEEAKKYTEWLKIKTEMKLNPNIEKDYPLFSKGVYYINLGKGIGAELEKDRPCILLSGSKESETVIVIPISDEDKYKDSTFWYHIHLSSGDTALLEQIRTVSKTRIRRPIRKGNKVRSILPEECKKINLAIDKLKVYVKDKR